MDIKFITEHLYSLYHEIHLLHIDIAKFWYDNILLSWRWWVLVSFLIVPWILWLIIRKKESTQRFLFVGFFVMIVSALLDKLGTALGLWFYPISAFPLIPEFLSYD